MNIHEKKNPVSYVMTNIYLYKIIYTNIYKHGLTNSLWNSSMLAHDPLLASISSKDYKYGLQIRLEIP